MATSNFVKPKTPLDVLREQEQANQQAADSKMSEASKKENAITGASAVTGAGGLADNKFNQYKVLASNLEDTDQQYFNDKLNELQQRTVDARKEYSANKNRTEWLQVAERLGHAFTQLGAAVQGMKSGVDMSGLKFDKANWDNQYNNLLKELDMNLEGIRGERGEVTGYRNKLEDVTASAQRERERNAARQNIANAKAGAASAKAASTKASKDEQKYNEALQIIDELGDEKADSKEYSKAVRALIDIGYTQPDAVKLLEKQTSGYKIPFTDIGAGEGGLGSSRATEEIKKSMGERRSGGSAAPSGGPKPGDVVDGYEFKGGNPADPKAWQQVKKQ